MTKETLSDAELHQFTVGSFDCTVVSDGTYAYPHPAQLFFADAPSDELAPALEQYGIDPVQWDEYVSPYPSLVIETGDHTVLVDTGAGEIAPTTGKLQAALGMAGIAAETVDVVVLTHGHADHVGGTLDSDGNPAFPNARYVMSTDEWEFWTEEPDLSSLRVDDSLKDLLVMAARANLAPLEDHVDLFGGETGVVPGITVLPAPGHTPGHVAVDVESGDERLLNVVDTVLHPLHVERPEWTAAVDYDPRRTVETRRALLQQASDDDVLVFAAHFPAPGLGRISARNETWEWQPLDHLA